MKSLYVRLFDYSGRGLDIEGSVLVECHTYIHTLFKVS